MVQPLKDVETIRARQSAVKELLANTDLLEKLCSTMKALPKDHEAVCLRFATTLPSSKIEKGKWITGIVSKLMRLQNFLQSLHVLEQALASSQTILLQAIHAALSSCNVSPLLEMLKETLEERDAKEDAVLRNITHQIFAFKCPENSVLDIARKDFLQTSEQVHQLAENYRTSSGIHKLKLLYTPKRKFHLALGKKVVHEEYEEGLPELFIPLQGKSQTNFLFSTLELNVLNSRLQTSLDDCFEILSNTVQAVGEQIRGNILQLRVLAEAVSTLDLLLSFAAFAKENADAYTCPDIESEGPLLIVEGKHPQMKSNAEPNSTFLSKTRSFEIISGPNMAGKSTYSRQVALIAILGHMGCFVPATYARIPLLSSILTRCTVRHDSGNIEDNVSSFYMEMQDIARITNSLGPGSLVIVDEIGRSTSDSDGEAIAWSVAECLLAQKGVYSIFISHFQLLKQMPCYYPRCLYRTFSAADISKPHKLSENLLSDEDGGELESRQYGIALAENIGYPEDVIERARHMSRLVAEEKQDTSRQLQNKSLRLKFQAYDHLEVLGILSNKSDLSEETLRSELGALQQELRSISHRQAPSGAAP
jgi:DNA mismatch repair protein MSH4